MEAGTGKGVDLMRRTVVYLACPMSIGSHTQNVINCIKVADELIIKGYSPIVPVLTSMWDIVSPKTHEEWLQYDFGLVGVSDCLLRIPGVSVGADMEMDYAVRNVIPVFTSRYDLYTDMPSAQEIPLQML